MKYLIIGGVAGGATAAARIRRQDEMGEIVLVEKGQHISYANCGLPYYIGGVIKDRQRLFVQTPESFSRRFNIDVRVQNEALAIHPDAHTVTIRDAKGQEHDEHYDRLLLAPGAQPVRPRLEGIDNEGVFTLRDIADTDRIKAFVDAHPHGKAVIVGGGFIGLEMAENLVNAGLSVDIVEMANQVMGPLDFSMASMVHSELSTHGVGLYLGKAVEKLGRQNGRLQVNFADGEGVEADMVLLSIGVRPNTKLAADAGLTLGARGIQVNDYLQTSDPDIYAVGDAVEFTHPLTGQPWLNYLAGPANRQARIAADNMVRGNHETYEGSIGTSIAKVFGLDVATTGLPAKRLKQMGMAYTSSTTTSASHAGYYPGAFNMTIKLTFDPKSGKLYGGQCIGHGGVDKRIDEIALTIKRGGTIYDLISMEQAYAPPFSSAKDPLAIAGYVASNIISGDMPVIYWRELRDMDRKSITLLDVRTPDEYALGTIEGAKNIPLDDLRQRLAEIPADRPIVVFCAVGLRGYLAQRILMGRGFKNVRNLSGGYKLYHSATQPVSNRPAAEGTATSNGSESGTPLHASTEGVSAMASEAASTVNGGGSSSHRQLHLDACGLSCPGPIIELKKAMDGMAPGETIEVTATDPGFPRDAKAWSASTGNEVLSTSEDNGYHKVVVRKGQPQPVTAGSAPAAQNKTLIMFSDDLDRAIATFVLANGAAATGKKVSIFFTFWGLNVLKKEVKPKVKKDFFGRMFGWMLPSSSRHLHLSQMSFFGLGDKLMRHIMRQKGIDQLEELRQKAQDAGVEFIACQMTMDMMGIHKEELLDGVTVGGVATYMQRAEQANVNLFI